MKFLIKLKISFSHVHISIISQFQIVDNRCYLYLRFIKYGNRFLCHRSDNKTAADFSPLG